MRGRLLDGYIRNDPSCGGFSELMKLTHKTSLIAGQLTISGLQFPVAPVSYAMVLRSSKQQSMFVTRHDYGKILTSMKL